MEKYIGSLDKLNKKLRGMTISAERHAEYVAENILAMRENDGDEDIKLYLKQPEDVKPIIMLLLHAKNNGSVGWFSKKLLQRMGITWAAPHKEH